MPHSPHSYLSHLILREMRLKDYLAGFAVSGQSAEGGSGIIAGVGSQRGPWITEVTAKAVLSSAQALGAHTCCSKSLLFTFPPTS